MEDSGPSIEVVLAHPTRTFDTGRVEACVRAVLDGEQIPHTYVGVILADASTVHTLNRDYLQHDYETDVLSFGLHENGSPIEGEVYVDLDTAARNAPEFGTSFEDEVLRYAIHGVLHLCGYLDSDESLRSAMRALEDRYLAAGRHA